MSSPAEGNNRCAHNVRWVNRCLQCDVDIPSRVLQLVFQELKYRPLDEAFDGRIFDADEWPKTRRPR